MQSNFQSCLAVVLVEEGGYVNNPEDPGGATNHGVTQAVYDVYRRSVGAPKRTVHNITPTEYQSIYKASYWNKVHGDSLPKGVDLMVFDAAVNSGTKTGAMFLQHALGVKADGDIGEVTLAALAENTEIEYLIKQIAKERLSFWQSLTTWHSFGKGWTARGNAVEAAALKMIEAVA